MDGHQVEVAIHQAAVDGHQAVAATLVAQTTAAGTAGIKLLGKQFILITQSNKNQK